MDKDTLHEIELHCFQMDIDIAPYAGNAFLDDNTEQMEFFKGFHRALVMMRKHIEEKRRPLLLKEYKEEEQAVELFRGKKDGKLTFAEHVKKQMATLKDYDHKLFEDIVDGLKHEGWVEEGGSPTYRLLHKYESGAIKIFRNEEAPAVIKICFSAEPEEFKKDEAETKETKKAENTL